MIGEAEHQWHRQSCLCSLVLNCDVVTKFKGEARKRNEGTVKRDDFGNSQGSKMEILTIYKVAGEALF